MNGSIPVPKIITKNAASTGAVVLAVNVDPMRELVFLGGENESIPTIGLSLEAAIALSRRLMDAAQTILDNRANPGLKQ
jgi:hypothetical protein